MLSTVDQKLIKSTVFPPEFDKKVDRTKIDNEVIKIWIASKIAQIIDDELVIDLCFNLLEESRFPDIKKIQIQLTGFLDKEAAPFCKELWNLCLSAQASENGIPVTLLKAKVEELRQKAADAKNNAAQAHERLENDRARQNRGLQSRFRDKDRDHDRDRRHDRYNDGPRGIDRHRSQTPPPSSAPPRGRRKFEGGDSYVPSHTTNRSHGDSGGRGSGRNRSPHRTSRGRFSLARSISREPKRGRSISRSSDEESSDRLSSNGREGRRRSSPSEKKTFRSRSYSRSSSRSPSRSPPRSRPSRRHRSPDEHSDDCDHKPLSHSRGSWTRSRPRSRTSRMPRSSPSPSSSEKSYIPGRRAHRRRKRSTSRSPSRSRRSFSPSSDSDRQQRKRDRSPDRSARDFKRPKGESVETA